MEDEIVNGSMLFNNGDANNDIVKNFMDNVNVPTKTLSVKG